MTGSTGETFAGFLSYLKSDQPELFFGEMVSLKLNLVTLEP